LEQSNALNEGTYVNTVIMPVIHAVLKGMPFGSCMFISCGERHSSASADRKDNLNRGRKPDLMVEVKRNSSLYENLYAECSRVSCPQRESMTR